jgi:hypothetical protein
MNSIKNGVKFVPNEDAVDYLEPENVVDYLRFEDMCG